MNCENFITDDVLDARIAYSHQTLDSKHDSANNTPRSSLVIERSEFQQFLRLHSSVILDQKRKSACLTENTSDMSLNQRPE